MKFIDEIRGSIYNPRFYEEITEKPLKKALLYYLRYAASLTLVVLVFFSVFTLPNIVSLLSHESLTKIADYYPKDLEIKITKGKVTTNVKEPYFVKFPQPGNNGGLSNFFVIETKRDFDRVTFENYKTFALLTSDSLVFKDVRKNSITIQSLATVKDTVINYGVIQGIIKKIERFRPFTIPLLLILNILYNFIIYSLYILYALALGLLVILIGKIKEMDMSYKGALAVSLHALTLPLFIKFFFDWILGIKEPLFLFSAIFLLIVALNVKNTIPKASEATI